MKLVWLDLETTGLDPRTDRILEVAAAVADLSDPFATGPMFERVIHHDGRGLSPFIVDMHTKNGLLAECAASHHAIEHVERELLALIPEEAAKDEKPTLAGNSVHFDLSFVRQWMPRLAARLSHRVYDVSAVKLFARSMGMPNEKGPEVHRAAADVRASVGWLHCGEDFRATAYEEPNFGKTELATPPDDGAILDLDPTL